MIIVPYMLNYFFIIEKKIQLLSFLVIQCALVSLFLLLPLCWLSLLFCKCPCCLVILGCALSPSMFGEWEKKTSAPDPPLTPSRGPCSPGPHLSASMATLAFCSVAACWLTAEGQPGGGWACWGEGPWVHKPCWLGTGGVMPQLTGGGGGEVAMLGLLLLLKLSEALSRENMVRASGKFGGVAGVLAGVHIWKQTDKITNVFFDNVHNCTNAQNLTIVVRFGVGKIVR